METCYVMGSSWRAVVLVNESPASFRLRESLQLSARELFKVSLVDEPCLVQLDSIFVVQQSDEGRGKGQTILGVSISSTNFTVCL